MANTCRNRVVVAHVDPAMTKRFIDAYRRGVTAQEFLPMPIKVQGGPAAERRDWRLCHWDSRSDFGENVGGTPPIHQGCSIECVFNSDGSPPFQVYLELLRLGYEVKGSFCAIDCGVCGRFENNELTYYGIHCSQPACVRRFIDPELVREFGIDQCESEDEDECDHDDNPWVQTVAMDLDAALRRRKWLAIMSLMKSDHSAGPMH